MNQRKNYPQILIWFKGLLIIMLITWIGIMARNDLKKWYYIGKPVNVRDTISVHAEGKVVALPDIAMLNVGIRTENKTVNLAQKENTEKMNALIKKIKKLGIESKDIETQQYNISPRYDYVQEKGRELRGYEVLQNIKLKIRNLDNISKVLEIAGHGGSNEVGNLQFTVDNPEKLRAQAREKAFVQAKEKAKVLIKSLGVKLGRVVNYNESNQDNIPQPIFRAQALGVDYAESKNISPLIEKGSQEVKVSVTVEYEIL